MKRIFVGLLNIILLAGLVSCAGWQKTSTNSFTGAGVGLTVAETAVKPACDSGAIAADACAKIKVDYQIAYKSYVSAGSILILALTTTDAVQQKQLQAQWTTIMANFNQATIDMVALIQQIQAGKYKGSMALKASISPALISILIQVFEAVVQQLPQITSWINSWSVTQSDIATLVAQIKAAQASLPVWN